MDSGSAHCPCIDPWADTQAVRATETACREYTTRSSQGCVPADYGALRCDAWDAGLPPSCATGATLGAAAGVGPPAGAVKPWCA